jgi:peroxidase
VCFVLTPLFLFLLYHFAILQQTWPSFDGYGNNVNNPTWGANNAKLNRDNMPWNYADGISEPISNLPSPRYISNVLFGHVPANPSSKLPISDMHTYWGQFLDHDITLTPENFSETIWLGVPQGDPIFDPHGTGNVSLPFHRSVYDPTTGTGVNNPRAQINVISAYIDGSMVYGYSLERANALRDTRGRLKTSIINGHVYPPKNTMGLPNANPNRLLPNDQLFVCGDERSNENPGLTVLHTLFIREHNRLANKFATEHPDWSDEQIFQTARKWVVAEIQSITFNEYVPATTGRPLPPYTGYNASVNAGIMAAFSTVAFRYGHSEVNMIIPRLDENRRPIPQGPILFRDGYFNPPIWVNEGIDPMIRGSAAQLQQEVDLFYVPDVRSFLFGLPGAGGIDLALLTIERGRDHGMPFYNDIRRAYGLPPRNFDQITSDQTIVRLMSEVYGDVNRVDAFVGGLAEDHPPGSHVGELFQTIILEQYRRLRDGDRFFYRSPAAGFTEAEIREIDNTRLSTIILRNTGIQAIQCNVFFLSNTLDCGNVTSNNPVAPGASSSITVLNGRYTLSWAIQEPNIEITIKAQTDGWVGFGIPQNPGIMVGADVVAGWVDPSGQAHVADYFITARQPGCPGVCPDTQQGGNNDIISYAGSRVNGITTITFVRPLAARDPGLDREISLNGDVPIIFAMGDTNTGLSYHGPNRGGTTVNFRSGAVTPGQEPNTRYKQRAHGFVMVTAWFFLLPGGIFMASFFKHLHSWFRLHILIQTLGVLLAISGLIIAVEFTAELRAIHFNGVHQVFGLITLLIMITAPYLGFLADMCFVPNRPATPFFPDKVHWISGYSSALLAIVTIYLGLWRFGAPVYAWVLLIIWNVIEFGLYILCSYLKAKHIIGEHFKIEPEPQPGYVAMQSS